MMSGLQTLIQVLDPEDCVRRYRALVFQKGQSCFEVVLHVWLNCVLMMPIYSDPAGSCVYARDEHTFSKNLYRIGA